MRWLFWFLPLFVLSWHSVVLSDETPPIEHGVSEYKQPEHSAHETTPQKPTAQKSVSTTDHSKLEELQGPFSSGPEVTRACLGCHNKAGDQFVKNKHWTWEYTHPKTGQKLGKNRLVNGFCTNARGNEGMCAQCHAGYNRTSPDYDLTKQENIDCLVCHDGTGSYYKTPTTKGNKACLVMFEGMKPIDWTKVAQSVAKPSRQNCGQCHFFGGGADNVKHGDLSSVLLNPPKSVDVHMDAKGLNFSCTTCHVGEGHNWAGSRYQMTVQDEKAAHHKPGMPRETATCVSCHSEKPHPVDGVVGIKLNSHTQKVACETCHIPSFARGGVATITHWNWRSMGDLKDGEGYKIKGYTQGDGHHRATYKSIKGNFIYGENVKPVYRWFDGTMTYTTIDTKFDPSQAPIELNGFGGAHDDPDSRIYPFKRMNTIQPYDKGNNTLVYMYLWGDDKDALWGNYDLQRAITAGMSKQGKPYSGEYGYVETYSYWPTNHMVAPKEEALSCVECHATDGRLKELSGFYMPGTGSSPLLDRIGLFAVLATLLGVLGHALLRWIAARGRKA